MSELKFNEIIAAQARKYGNVPVLFSRKKQSEAWTGLGWVDFEKEIETVAKSLASLGVKEQQCVGQFSQNMVQNLVVDFALFANRAVMIPVYATSTAAQLEFIVRDAEISVLFVGEQQQYNAAVEVMNRTDLLKKLIVFDDSVELNPAVDSVYYKDFLTSGQTDENAKVVESRKLASVESDLACILYTSGTTGNPKGVMLPHSCFMEAMRIHKTRLTSLSDQDVSIAFLPLSHVFERAWSYLCLYCGIKNYINLKPTEIQQTVKDVRPTLMCAVPRFWEKVYAGVQENIAAMTPFMIGVVSWAVAVGKKYNLDYKRVGKTPNLWLKLKYRLADQFIFAKVKKTVGIENANMLPAAGAKLSDEIAIFMKSIGVPIVYGYGLTESTATISCFDYVNYEIGTVGSLMPDVQVRIGEDNEILVKGKTIFPGYYKNEEATKAAFTEDGWFKTGDAGLLKGDKIVLTERIKDLFKTSNGKYIAPQEIETRLTLDKYIEQVAVIADERNFATAIVVPDLQALESYAKKAGIQYASLDELLGLPAIYQFIESRILDAQKGMANYEIIKKFVLIKKGFSIETGELTNTLKIRRAVIMQKYKLQIDAMYS